MPGLREKQAVPQSWELRAQRLGHRLLARMGRGRRTQNLPGSGPSAEMQRGDQSVCRLFLLYNLTFQDLNLCVNRYSINTT